MILVVEDEPAIVEVIRSVLEDEGHVVESAPDGVAALEMLRDGIRPCLAIVDLMMPRMNGWQLREQMLAEPDLADIPVAVVSAFVGEVSDLDVSAIIRKPFDLAQIVEVAEQHCAPG